jgi:hypothetical protein
VDELKQHMELEASQITTMEHNVAMLSTQEYA